MGSYLFRVAKKRSYNFVCFSPYAVFVRTVQGDVAREARKEGEGDAIEEVKPEAPMCEP
jgi:hypothetical protein